MKPFATSKTLLHLLACTFLAGTVTLSAHAADCKTPRGMVEKRACEKAAQGPDALRRFVERTRMIYGLYYWDYVPRNEDAQLAKLPSESTIARAK